jgi:mRNA-degrading endonuclease RelE of RelBE toxin-antitoxin system
MTTSDFAKVTRTEGFSRDLKKLIKRFRSLEEDLGVFIKAQLFAYHKLQIDNHGLFPIDNLGFESPQVYKAKKFACKSLKGKGAKSGIRIIYTYFPENDEIYFIEIYFKADKENEDRERIKELYKSEFSVI